MPVVDQSRDQNQEEQCPGGTDSTDPQPITFQGVELLERDPGLRPQIWEYPSNQRDQVHRAYLQLGPMQPLLKSYPQSQVDQRRFPPHKNI